MLRRQNIRCRLLALSAMLALPVLAASGCAAPEAYKRPDAEEKEYAPVTMAEDSGFLRMENEWLRLSFECEDYTFVVGNKSIGRLWHSNPPDRGEDPIAKARVRQSLSTMLIVHFVDDDGLADMVSSYTGSVGQNGASAGFTGNALRIVYKFPAQDFTVPVELTLEDDAFGFHVLTQEIEENGTNRIIGVEVLPFFGAGGPADEGYLLVPDGSGALIRFNNGKSMYNIYNEKVYGRDVSFDLTRLLVNKQTIHLPVFGIQNQNEGMLAVILQPAAASIKASVSGADSSYTAVRAYFELRSVDTYMMGETMGSRVKLVNIYQSGEIPYQSVGLRYYFLDKEHSGYVGMAGRYRQYLTEEKGMEKSDDFSARLYIEMLGAVRKSASRLGFPVTVTQPVTSYLQMAGLLERLNEAGVDSMAVRYNKWDQTSILGKPASRLSLESGLGGKKDWLSLPCPCG